MARNYAEITLHVTWHTGGSSPRLVPRVEGQTHHDLRGRCINTPGVSIHQIGVSGAIMSLGSVGTVAV